MEIDEANNIVKMSMDEYQEALLKNFRDGYAKGQNDKVDEVNEFYGSR